MAEDKLASIARLEKVSRELGVSLSMDAELLVARASARPAQSHGPVTMVSVACALCKHTLARTTDGKIYSWGVGEYGQLGHDDEEDQAGENQHEPKEILAISESLLLNDDSESESDA